MIKAVERLEKLEEERVQILEQGIEQFLKPFIKGKAMYVYIQGWTPEFNDGDPCTHCVDWSIGPEIVNYLHNVNNAEIFKGITTDELVKSRVINSTHKTYTLWRRSMLATIAYFDYTYTTNYQCLLLFKNNCLFTIKLDYFDPQY